MPRYEYHCDSCGESFEATHKMSDAALTTCTLCGCEGSVKRLMSVGSGVIFKGSGFYSTDYKKSSAASEPATTTTKTETKSDPTPPSSGGSCGSGCGCHP